MFVAAVKTQSVVGAYTLCPSHSHEPNGKNAQVATIKFVVPPFLAKRAVVGHCWTTVEGQLTFSRIKMKNKT